MNTNKEVFMKRKLLFLIPIITLLLFLSSCSLFNFGQNSTSSPQSQTSSSVPSKRSETPSTSTTAKESTSKQTSTSTTKPSTTTTSTAIPSTTATTQKATSASTSTEVHATSLVLEEENPSIYIERIDDDLEKIKMKVIYSDNTRESINLSKNLMSANDYNSLKTAGANTITVNYRGVSKNITITSSHMVKWEVNFLNYNNDVLKTEEVISGEAAMAPKNPSDYFDNNNNAVYTFDKWDKDFSSITSNTDVKAVFKVKEKVGIDYLAIINSGTSADITIEKSNSTSIYNLRVMDESNHLIQAVSNPTDKIELTNLNANTTYKISGTCMFYFNGSLQEVNIVESSFKTGIYDDIQTINDSYVIDNESVSSTSLCVDLTSYIDNAPDGFELKGVALVDSNDELIGEKEYDGSPIVFFDDLTPDTEYTTYFFYDKIKTNTLTAWTHQASGNEYRYYFIGFVIQTHPNDPNMKCARVIYNDPDDGEVLLYRYYVSSGNSVYNIADPFSFRLPIKYEGYKVIGDYSKLQNITDDIDVEVMLMPNSSSVDTDKHLVVFKNNNGSIISSKWVNDGGSITPPVIGTDFEFTLPKETADYAYVFKWYSPYDYDLSNITKSLELTASYTKVYKSNAPTYRTSVSFVKIGPTFASLGGVIENKTAIIADNPYTYYLSHKGQSDKIEALFFSNSYVTEFGFDSLTPNTDYEFHFSIEYYLDEEHTVTSKKEIVVPFTTTSSDVDYTDNPTFSSPYYHTIRINDGANNTVLYYAVISESDVSKGIAKIIQTMAKDYYNPRVCDCNYLNTNTEYRIYSLQKQTIPYTDDGTEKECEYYRYSGKYYTYSTIDGVRPLTFKLSLRVRRDGDYYQPITTGDNRNYVSLYITNYETQVDIGPLQIEYSYNVFPSDFQTQYGAGNVTYFEFDSSYGCYKPVAGYYNSVYADLFQNSIQVSDPMTGQTVTVHLMVDMLRMQYYYNGYHYTNSYCPSNDINYYTNSYVVNYTADTDNDFNVLFVEFY